MNPKTRAVSRRIETGENSECQKCKERIKFVSTTKATQVIANVYEKGIWNRVEHFHTDCYTAAGKPYGSPTPNIDRKVEPQGDRGRDRHSTYGSTTKINIT